MKILVYTDNHFCQNSSIVRGRGKIYSDRLENQIKTINWVEETACKNGCSLIINAGDFFDSPSLNSEEISALREIKWNNSAWHYFLVGNHDASNKSLSFSSTNLFSLCPNVDVIDRVAVVEDSTCAILFIPYISQSNLDEDIKITDLLDGNVILKEKVLLISHNDLKGVQFGNFVSKSGLSVDDIESHCNLCINGHLHNGEWVTKKILNLGNITGQNFSEDATTYKHRCVIVDTDNMSCTFITNPYAFNFYKIDVVNERNKIPALLDNAVVTIRCKQEGVSSIKEALDNNPQVIYSRIIAISDKQENAPGETIETLSVNHVDKFRTFIEDTLGRDTVVEEELRMICGGGV